MHRPIWRCIQECNKDKCTQRSWNKPLCCSQRLDVLDGKEPIWERYEPKRGQRHLDGVME